MTDTTYTTEDGRFTATVSFNASETTWGYYVYCYAGREPTSGARYDTKEEAHAHAEVWVKTMEAVT